MNGKKKEEHDKDLGYNQKCLTVNVTGELEGKVKIRKSSIGRNNDQQFSKSV